MGVKIRERKPGQWWVFVNHKGNRIAKFAGSLETAEAAREFIEKQIAFGQYEPPKREKQPTVETKPTLFEYWQRFHRVYLEASCRESTRERYEGNFKNYILPRFGEIPLDGISRASVKEFISDLRGLRREDGTPKLARDTIGNIIKEFCSLFSHAVEEEVLQANPMLRLPRLFKQAPVRHEEIDPLTFEEVPIFLQAAREMDEKKRYKDSPECYPLFLAAIHTGMRSGELAGLQWGDIDWRKNLICVRRAIKKGKVLPTKTGKVHRIDLSEILKVELEALRRRRREEYLATGKPEIPLWIFPNSDGGILDMQNMKNRRFYRCLEKAKLRRIRFHDLRHTFASLLIQNGESLAYVKEQMGHSSIRVTVDVYGHLIPGANRQAVCRLPGIKSATPVQPRQKETGEASE